MKLNMQALYYLALLNFLEWPAHVRRFGTLEHHKKKKNCICHRKQIRLAVRWVWIHVQISKFCKNKNWLIEGMLLKVPFHFQPIRWNQYKGNCKGGLHKLWSELAIHVRFLPSSFSFFLWALIDKHTFINSRTKIKCPDRTWNGSVHHATPLFLWRSM